MIVSRNCSVIQLVPIIRRKVVGVYCNFDGVDSKVDGASDVAQYGVGVGHRCVVESDCTLGSGVVELDDGRWSIGAVNASYNHPLNVKCIFVLVLASSWSLISLVWVWSQSCLGLVSVLHILLV